jgi:hypothetical protein
MSLLESRLAPALSGRTDGCHANHLGIRIDDPLQGTLARLQHLLGALLVIDVDEMRVPPRGGASGIVQQCYADVITRSHLGKDVVVGVLPMRIIAANACLSSRA